VKKIRHKGRLLQYKAPVSKPVVLLYYPR